MGTMEEKVMEDSYGLHLLADISSVAAVDQHLLDDRHHHGFEFRCALTLADLRVPKRKRSPIVPKKRMNFSIFSGEFRKPNRENTRKRRREEKVPKGLKKRKTDSRGMVEEVFKRLMEMLELSDFDYTPASWSIQPTSGLRLRIVKV